MLFPCTHNSARSQMAEGWLRQRYGDRFEAFSAGTDATHLRPLAIRAMSELGVDISGQTNKLLDRYVASRGTSFGAGSTSWWTMPEERGAPVRHALAEFIATAMLLIAVVGSGIAAQRLSPTDAGLQLLENAVVTGAALVAIILAFGPVSGAHMNPVVSVADAMLGSTAWREVPFYVAAQVCGGLVGTMIANLMFGLPAVSLSSHQRAGSGLWLGEVLATFGLLTVVYGVVNSSRPAFAPFAVGAYITGAYWFTSSTSFANPAVTLARMLSDTFAGIAPASAPMFILMQLAGGALGLAAVALLYPARTNIHNRKEISDMSSRVQLALNVSDVDQAVDFYSKLFQTKPAKRKPGYANFAISDPPLKLVLIENPGASSRLNHLGVEVFSQEAVVEAHDRLQADGLQVLNEDGVACCYAVQDKVWVSDPDAAPWEIYTVLEHSDQAGRVTDGVPCTCGTAGATGCA